MRKGSFVSSILLLLLLWNTAAHSSTIINGGNLTTQTWTLVNSPYIINGDIVVLSGETLTIEPGVIVKFSLTDGQGVGLDPARCELVVHGILKAEGTSLLNIIFTSNTTSPTNSDWYGIVIGPAGVVTMTHSEIEYCLHDIQPGVAGTITGAPTVCSGSVDVIYNVPTVARATSYVWTLPSGATGSSSSNSISVSFENMAISGDIKVLGRNAYGDGVESSFAISVTNPPAQPGSVSGTSTICSGSSNTFSVSEVSGATSYTWTLPGGWTGASTTNAIDALAGTTSGDVSVTANNTCPSAPQTLPITVNIIPAQPGPISGNETICSGTSNTYSITAVGGTTGYTWTLPSGWTGSSTTNSINTTASATQGDVSVTANNGVCSSPQKTLAILVKTIPGEPEPISENETNCVGVLNTFSVTNVSEATSYTWILPGGWTGNSTTNSIDATPSATSGNVSLTANNACGSSTARVLAVSVSSIPEQPGTISGDATVCAGSTGEYSIESVGGATSYTWTLPDAWTGNSTTNSINAKASSTVGDISVTANNACGSSQAKILEIDVIITPPQPTITSENSDTAEPKLVSSSNTGNQWFRNDVAIDGATDNFFIAPQTGVYSVEVNNNGCLSPRSEGFSIFITNIENGSLTGRMQIFPNPARHAINLALPEQCESCEVSIYDNLGRPIENKNGLSDKTILEISHYTQGIYYVIVRLNNEYYRMKLFKE